MDDVTLHTERLVLSRPRESDVDAIFAACQDADIQRYTTVPTPYVHGDAAAFVAKVAADWQSGAHLTWAMRRGDELAGMIGLYRLDGHGTGELGYWVVREARGAGLITEASVAVIDWGFSPAGLELDRIEWKAVAGNIASARAARAVGFRYEGLARQGLWSPEGRDDGWLAGVLAADERMPQPWSVLGD